MKNNICYIVTILLLSALGNGLFAQLPMQKHKGDPNKTRPRPSLQNVQSKEIITEFTCNPHPTVFLENIMRRVNIRVSNDNKVKLATTVYFQGNPDFTDEQWLEKLDLGISGNADNIVVKSGNIHKPGMKVATPQMPYNRRPDTIANGIAVFDSSGNWVNTKSNIKRNIILYIPANTKLDIENKYADITLENNVKEVKVRLTNGGLNMMDAEKLIINSVYGSVYCGNTGIVQADITNGRLSAKNIGTLDITSKNSSFDLRKVNHLKMGSQADNFEIDEVNVVSGEKNYGDLRITTLSTSLDLTGVNADIKIRSIDPNVGLVKISNQYADLRLPIGVLKNYQVTFEGKGGNVYAPFVKSRLDDNSFKTTIGSASGKSTLFQLKCDNCTLDFN